MVTINFFRKSEHFDVLIVFKVVQNKRVTNFLLVAVHNEAHRRSVRDSTQNHKARGLAVSAKTCRLSLHLISQLQCIFWLKISELYQLYSEHLAHSHTVTSWRWMIVQIQHNLWMQKLVLTSGWCHAMQAPVLRGHTTFVYLQLFLQNFMYNAFGHWQGYRIWEIR